MKDVQQQKKYKPIRFKYAPHCEVWCKIVVILLVRCVLYPMFWFLASQSDAVDNFVSLKPDSISSSRGAVEIICVQQSLERFYTWDADKAFTQVLIWLTNKTASADSPCVFVVHRFKAWGFMCCGIFAPWSEEEKMWNSTGGKNGPWLSSETESRAEVTSLSLLGSASVYVPTITCLLFERVNLESETAAWLRADDKESAHILKRERVKKRKSVVELLTLVSAWKMIYLAERLTYFFPPVCDVEMVQ